MVDGAKEVRIGSYGVRAASFTSWWMVLAHIKACVTPHHPMSCKPVQFSQVDLFVRYNLVRLGLVY